MAETGYDPRDESDQDLLELMALKSEFPSEAEQAFRVFYARHVKYLFSVCNGAYHGDLDAQEIEDLVQNAFWRVFEKAALFNSKKGISPEDGTRLVLAWVGQITNRIFLSEMRRRGRRLRCQTGNDEAIESAVETEPAPLRALTPDELLVRDGMQAVLDLRERRILEAFASHYDPELEHQRSPEGIVDALCKEFSTTEESIRQIRRRALKKLEDYISRHRQAKEERSPSYA